MKPAFQPIGIISSFILVLFGCLERPVQARLLQCYQYDSVYKNIYSHIPRPVVCNEGENCCELYHPNIRNRNNQHLRLGCSSNCSQRTTLTDGYECEINGTQEDCVSSSNLCNRVVPGEDVKGNYWDFLLWFGENGKKNVLPNSDQINQCYQWDMAEDFYNTAPVLKSCEPGVTCCSATNDHDLVNPLKTKLDCGKNCEKFRTPMFFAKLDGYSCRDTGSKCKQRRLRLRW